MQNVRLAGGSDTPFISIRAKDPGSALTHCVAFVLSVLATPALLVRAGVRGAGLAELVSLSVFMVSMSLLYAASTLYHTLNLTPKVNRRLKKSDHMMIFILIAGTYTPYCTLVMGGSEGKKLLLLIWAIAGVGVGLKACWVTCPKWFSSVIYIAMGWVCIAYLPALYRGGGPATFFWLFAGGVLYTVGGVIYALKLQVLGGRYPHFGSHEVFHLFVMGGSACHYISLLQAL